MKEKLTERELHKCRVIFTIIFLPVCDVSDGGSKSHLPLDCSLPQPTARMKMHEACYASNTMQQWLLCVCTQETYKNYRMQNEVGIHVR